MLDYLCVFQDFPSSDFKQPQQATKTIMAKDIEKNHSSDERELEPREIKDDIITLSEIREKALSFRPGEGESKLAIALCRKQRLFLRGVKLLSPFFEWRLDSTLYKIKLNFAAGERTSFSQFFDMVQCIFDVKIGIELPFGANAHREGEYQMDILLATVQARHQRAGQGEIMNCLVQLRVGPPGKIDQSLFTENLLWLQMGSAKYAQSTLESDLTRNSGKRARANKGSSEQLLQEHAKYLPGSRYLAYPPVNDSYEIARVRQELLASNLPLYAQKPEGGST
jgi:hypothetical protein